MIEERSIQPNAAAILHIAKHGHRAEEWDAGESHGLDLRGACPGFDGVIDLLHTVAQIVTHNEAAHAVRDDADSPDTLRAQMGDRTMKAPDSLHDIAPPIVRHRHDHDAAVAEPV